MNNKTFFDKVGLPKQLVWAYFGILIFMMGDGIEQGWLSPYLVERGLSIQQSALLFTVYGITIAISAWFSGVLAEAYGVKKTMSMGLVLYLLGTVGFVGFSVPSLDYTLMLCTYALRGFGYPLFAYSFLVWIAYSAPRDTLGRAVGWFWFVFTGGLNVLGAYYSSWAIDRFGHLNTLWTSVLWALIGAFFALILNKSKQQMSAKSNTKEKMKELLKGITIMKEEPKVLIGGIIRVINTTAQFAFPVFLPMYMAEYGFTTTEWLQIWGTIFTANIAFNLIFGFVGDRIGWKNTIMWFGGVGCGITTLLFYYSPQFSSGNFWIVMLAGVLWGALLAGYVPLSALMPSLVKTDKGAAVSVLNLGAGLPVFVGPAIVGAFIGLIGGEGVIWILAGLYFFGAFLTRFITLPDNAKTA
ncbi:MAG: alpha-ketoglutarate permease [Bacteroidetes bacterium GWF2_42_66]|nr:MAG: alpha-ketoglutarate permease [Bacteroidetes bacterium GWA2_42_15]OFX97330.1 MAG: alpha-ketoglutarate permease [Bacteroidetes bacterium GWE2_42_39]OFY39967.1 MAG: alpha-ketoglutarate permease [Bacteroidetes bacterium GWF2_42_66]HAZ03514.1 MFS transporter [Marinilabiliales bacterium]HBL78156.1 MFS transporter [Prolixibacteraceae bacterium]